MDIHERLRRIRHVALDMDGTIYSGSTLFPFTCPFLDLLGRLDIGYTFLTNNSSKSEADYRAYLDGLGIAAEPGQVFTSAHATIEYLKERFRDARKLFVLGTHSLREQFEEAGWEIARDDPDDEPDAVVVGFDMTLDYARLCRAAYWIDRDKPFIATHPDLVCPTDQPTVLVDCGAITACLEKATGRTPEVPGKPDPSMLRGVLKRHGLAPEEMAMAGDRIYTDMEMARRAEAFSVLVLTGESTAEDAERAENPPDLVVADLEEFGRLLSKARS